ncbi:hypothetical protein MA16_Dca021879 [Dendrobium catenatum]|uniref:Uncharacterized protein n=1 Tax=Dendrobium catenatum TaxID=906689 RepID=A0A2I0WHI5_9ASPA|nr:hypothetical protein MA16_Dca025375 [Dendrobium catenatum]PKU75108.1 hypothetical protein MA16_Dca021879 [Dendrobium catenatum]
MNQHEHLYVARTRHVMSKSNSLEEIPYDINQASHHRALGMLDFYASNTDI